MAPEENAQYGPWRQGLLRRGHGQRARPDRTPRPGQAGPRHQARRQAARARGPRAGPRPDDPRNAHAQRAWIGDPARADPAAHPGKPRHRGVPVTAAVRCTDVTKSYRDLRAVDGISFEVRQGEIFGIVGPNGAGKTTLLECIEGLRTRDTGVIEVFGMDPERQTREVRERTGVQLQSAALPTHITVAEALDLFASFYATPADWRPLLPRLGLEDKRDTYVEKLSGGQRQRVFIALALINDPELVFLDELTTGLDPQSRLAIWDVIREIRDGGATVVLTTHFMEEAERLCDRVAIIDHGRVVALDTVPRLIGSIAAESRITITVSGTPPLERLRAVPGVVHAEQTGDRVTVRGTGTRLAQDVMAALAVERRGAGHGDRDAALRGDRADQSGDGVEGDDAAVVDDRDPVAEPLGLLHEVRGEHDGRAAVADLPDDVPDRQAGLRVQPGGQLVEEDELGVIDQRKGDEHALALAARELLDIGVALVLEPEAGEQGTPVGGGRVEGGEQVQRLGDRDVCGEGGGLELDAGALADLAGLPLGVHAEDLDDAGVAGAQALDALQEGGLAGAVGATIPKISPWRTSKEMPSTARRSR